MTSPSGRLGLPIPPPLPPPSVGLVSIPWFFWKCPLSICYPESRLVESDDYDLLWTLDAAENPEDILSLGIWTLPHVWVNNQLNLAKAIDFYAVRFYTKQGL